MAIEDILQTLDEQASADIEAVLEEARQHAKLIMDEATRDADRIRDGYAHHAQRSAGSEAAKRVNAARLEAKMKVSSARGRAVEQAFTSAAEALTSARSDSGYDTLFAKLAAEAFEGLTGPVVVHVDPVDEARANSLAAPGVTVTVVPDLQTSGGLVVEANGGRVVRRNTLEDRLDRSRQYVQADVAKALFE